MTIESSTPDRRVASAVASALAEQRMNHMEIEMAEVKKTLGSIDDKFDKLRSDLFETPPFVTHRDLASALASRDDDIKDLKAARQNSLSTSLVVIGLVITVLIAIGSPILYHLMEGP